ncbi:MAG: LysR family transcriptional regulator [Myxococcota bacterium]
MNNSHDLVSLHALLETGSVTRAAKWMGVTQSAMSHTLARLRADLGDPLLVRSGRGLVPTARAEAMAPRLREAVEALEAAMAAAPAFHPATARRTLRVATTDLVELALLPAVLARLGHEAPGVDLQVRAALDAETALAAGQVDLAIQPLRADAPVAGLRTRALFHERFTCAMRRGHPLAEGELTPERFAAARHALVAPRGTPGGVVDEVLAARGLSRRTVVIVPTFLVVPHLVATTDLVVTLPERIAVAFAGLLPLAVVPHPLDLPGFTISMVWHERAHADPGHRWLRGLFLEAATG